MNKYSNIIGLPHFQSVNHKKMSNHDRAAQFAPFKALNGYEESIDETARITESKAELSDEQKSYLDRCISFMSKNLNSETFTKIEYFSADSKKTGGIYLNYSGYLKRIDLTENKMYFKDGMIFNFNEIIDIQSDDFPLNSNIFFEKGNPYEE